MFLHILPRAARYMVFLHIFILLKFTLQVYLANDNPCQVTSTERVMMKIQQGHEKPIRTTLMKVLDINLETEYACSCCKYLIQFSLLAFQFSDNLQQFASCLLNRDKYPCSFAACTRGLASTAPPPSVPGMSVYH